MQKNIHKKNAHYHFLLFVIKDGSNSERAKKNLNHLCEKLIPEHYSIEMVDVVENFQKALDYNILLTPSVVITEPEPRVTIYGDLSHSEKLERILNQNEGR